MVRTIKGVKVPIGDDGGGGNGGKKRSPLQRFTPLLIDAARSCRHAPGDRWFVDETYVKVAGRWVYLYRAIDQFGQVIHVLVLHPIEADHGRVKSWLRPMRSVTQLRSARVISTGHAFVQNLRRGHYELEADTEPRHRLPAAFAELAGVI